jgi:hypothetical protein
MKKIAFSLSGEEEEWLRKYAKMMKMNCNEAAKRLMVREIQTMKDWSSAFASPIKQRMVHPGDVKTEKT